MVRFACTLAATIIVSSPALAAGCRVDRFYAPYGIDTDVHMEAKSGAPCKIRMKKGSVAGITISQGAHHGIATLTDDRIVYTSRAGYTGPDQFVFQKYGEAFVGEQSRHVQGTSRFTVNVEVSP